MLKIYNSLTRKVEEFTPLNPDEVKMYTCGPTVYDYASIGNFRTYTVADVLYRTLKFNRYQVKYVMNLTDVGHLTGDNQGDADTGEDRMEKGAKKEGKTAWQIADFYSQAFLNDFKKLNLSKPMVFARATDHIKEQVELVKNLESKGLTYKIDDGIYFDTKKFEETTGKKYGQLSDLAEIKEGARVSKNPQKKDPRDFALWKFSNNPGKRHMEWDSPWGIGFPGWHLECSAMSMKYLGESFDIHAGGEDLKQIHHPNEIAQSEGATGKLFVKYWLHVRFLLVEGKKMSKSLGNFYTVSDVEKKKINPIALRYLYLTAHYQDPLNFTWEALESAHNTLSNLYSIAREIRSENESERKALSEEKMQKIDFFRQNFVGSINDNLNTPKALAILWEAVKSNIPSSDKLDLMYLFDEVLGLKIVEISSAGVQIPQDILNLNVQREEFRKKGDYLNADKLRKEIELKGYKILDTKESSRILKA